MTFIIIGKVIQIDRQTRTNDIIFEKKFLN